jgi:hypothetical protein
LLIKVRELEIAVESHRTGLLAQMIMMRMIGLGGCNGGAGSVFGQSPILGPSPMALFDGLVAITWLAP